MKSSFRRPASSGKMQDRIEIQFLNHASFLITSGSVKILFDPWFSGPVFNRSWRLLSEIPSPDEMLHGVTHVVISHEHPDHFHFPSLKRVSQVARQKVTLIFPNRQNPEFACVAEKLGMIFQSAKRGGSPISLSDQIHIAYFGGSENHDNTIVVQAGENIIVNQNDHYTGNALIKKIKKRYPKIDLLMTQFSLAGFYANHDHPEGIIKQGREFHLNRIEKYCQALKPKWVLPFASFIYFSDPYNHYLNQYIVRPHEVKQKLKAMDQGIQFVMPMDQILFDGKKINDRNTVNLQKLNDLFAPQNRVIEKPEPVDMDELKNLAETVVRRAPLLKKLLENPNAMGSHLNGAMLFIRS